MSSNLKRIMLALLIILVSATMPVQSTEPTPVTIGQRVTIQSAILKEERHVIIATPPGYETSGISYPVLYLTDGAGDFYHAYGVARNYANYRILPSMIIVAIENTNRNRDLTPTHTRKGFMGDDADYLKDSGGADRFLDFIEKELFPYVENNYRTLPFRVLSGHSFGGLLVVHTFLNRTPLFNGYIGITPSLWWDDRSLCNQAEKRLPDMNCKQQFLYLTVGGDEHENQVGANQQLARLLKEHVPEGLDWSYNIMKQENHGSQGLPALDAGLRFIYRKWQPPTDLLIQGLDALKKFYAGVEETYGVTIQVPENSINTLGYYQMRRGELDTALATMQYNVELYPNSPNVHDSIGDVYNAREEWAKAETSYRKAVELAAAVNHPNLSTYKQHLEDLKEKRKDN